MPMQIITADIKLESVKDYDASKDQEKSGQPEIMANKIMCLGFGNKTVICVPRGFKY